MTPRYCCPSALCYRRDNESHGYGVPRRLSGLSSTRDNTDAEGCLHQDEEQDRLRPRNIGVFIGSHLSSSAVSPNVSEILPTLYHVHIQYFVFKLRPAQTATERKTEAYRRRPQSSRIENFPENTLRPQSTSEVPMFRAEGSALPDALGGRAMKCRLTPMQDCQRRRGDSTTCEEVRAVSVPVSTHDHVMAKAGGDLVLQSRPCEPQESPFQVGVPVERAPPSHFEPMKIRRGCQKGQLF